MSKIKSSNKSKDERIDDENRVRNQAAKTSKVEKDHLTFETSKAEFTLTVDTFARMNLVAKDPSEDAELYFLIHLNYTL